MAFFAEICAHLRSTSYSMTIGPEMLNAVTLMEEQLLSHIKRVAVKSIHVKVHRWHFANIKPNEGETITRFVGHFKSQASLCNFSTKCYSGSERTTSYSEQMISQQLTMGLTNPDNQARMLNEASQLETLQLKNYGRRCHDNRKCSS